MSWPSTDCSLDIPFVPFSYFKATDQSHKYLFILSYTKQYSQKFIFLGCQQVSAIYLMFHTYKMKCNVKKKLRIVASKFWDRSHMLNLAKLKKL
jgi:hypothetical protein